LNVAVDSMPVRLSCLEDNAQGEVLEVLWEHEIDARLLREPDNVRQSYIVKATRVEAVGLIYLWPLSS
jgi:hypothetical protein